MKKRDGEQIEKKKKGIWGFGLLDYKKNKEFSYHLFISFLEG